MASSSTSSSNAPTKWKFDIFLSFRGEDTRKNFVDHLYTELERKGINDVFRDDNELERGREILPDLVKVIEESRFSIIVFSEKYAFSSWCLDELVKIIDCTKEIGHQAFPIFYNVDPSNVRNQKGSYGEAFAKHENDGFLENSEKVQRWKSALTHAANLAGWDSRKYSYESKLIQEIGGDMFYMLNLSLPHVDNKLVGMDFHLEEIKIRLNTTSSDDVKFVGIYGLGGIGKTTIAKSVYNMISIQFEGCSYLADVREKSKKDGLVSLQEQLLCNILHVSDLKRVSDMRSVIKNRLCRKKVLVILDDLDHLEQLQQLAGEYDWFGPGSRIIITTRDEHLLDAHGVHEKYKVRELGQDKSLELFSLKAFKQNLPPKDYLEMSNKVVDYAKGLPLALEVLGSFLCGRNETEWNSELDKLKKVPNKEIINILKISYDGLDQTQKDIFLDIACFFKGSNKGHVTKILEGCGFNASIGISVLNERSLISLSDNNELLMHDLVQDMGRDIVFQDEPKDPGKRSRLWLYEDIHDVLTNNVGTKRVEAIMLEDSSPGGYELRFLTGPECFDLHLSAEAFTKMYNLRLLKIQDVYVPDQGLGNLSDKLRVFHWHQCPLEYFPSNFQPGELVELTMHYGHIKQLWNGRKALKNLISIDLTNCYCLTEVPDLTYAPILEKLILDGCKKLFELHPSIGVLKRLKYFSLRRCTNLRCLPSKIEMQSLETLDLCGCENLKNLPELLGNMKRLSKLMLKHCKNLVSLPNSICRLKYLEELVLDYCSKLEKLPEKLGNLESLVELNASCTAIKEAPPSIVRLKNLQWLSFAWCRGTSSDSRGLKLQSLSGLCSLKYLDLNWCNLSEIPSSIGSLSSLESLYLTEKLFVSLPSSICLLSHLTILNLDHCKLLQTLPELPSSIQILYANGCTSLERVSIASTVFKPKNVYFGFINCYNLVNQNAPSLTDVLQQFQNQALFGNFETISICLPGNAIPGWFSHRNVGSSTSILLPPNRDNNKLRGLAFCIVTDVCLPFFEIQVFGVDLEENVGSGITVPKYASEFQFSCEGYGYPRCAHLMLGYVSRAMLGQNERQLTNVSFHFTDIEVKVKKCGIRLVYDDDNVKENGLKRSRSWKSSGESEKTPRIQ